MEELNCDLAKEIFVVLSFLDNIKIPDDIFEYIVKLAANSNKEVILEKGKNLNEQNISEECKNWIALFCYENCEENIQSDILNEWENNSISN